jgi:hypothetical protein
LILETFLAMGLLLGGGADTRNACGAIRTYFEVDRLQTEFNDLRVDLIFRIAVLTRDWNASGQWGSSSSWQSASADGSDPAVVPPEMLE